MSEFTIGAASLRRAFTTALAFAGTDDTLPVLAALSLKPVEGGVEVAATDRYVLCWETVKVQGGEPFGAVIPTHIVRRLLTMIPKGTVRKPVMGAVSFTKDGDRISARFVGEFEDFETEIAFAPLDEKFPRFGDMVRKFEEYGPEERAHEVHLNPYFVARVTKAIAARGSREPVGLKLRTADKPMQFTTDDGFNAAVMPVRVRDGAK